MGAEVESEKEGEEVSQDMDTEEEDNEGLFSTPKRGGTPAQPQDEPLVHVPSAPVFAAQQNLPAPPIFVLPAKSQEASLPTH